MPEKRKPPLGGKDLLKGKDSENLLVTQEKCVCLSCRYYCECGHPLWTYCKKYYQWRETQ